MYDIDKIGIDLMKSALAEDLTKTNKLSPKLKFKFMKWLKGIKPEVSVNKTEFMDLIKDCLSKTMVDYSLSSDLAKNEMRASSFDDGSVRLEFGSEVPESVKKAALKWAKKKGLNPVEAELMKSQNNISSYLFSSGSLSSKPTCTARRKWALDL